VSILDKTRLFRNRIMRDGKVNGRRKLKKGAPE
jgi:hypothetical protein